MQMHFIQLQHNSTKRECNSGMTVKPVKPENSRIFAFLSQTDVEIERQTKKTPHHGCFW